MARHAGHAVTMSTVLPILDDEGLLLKADHQRERRRLAQQRRAAFAAPPTPIDMRVTGSEGVDFNSIEVVGDSAGALSVARLCGGVTVPLGGSSHLSPGEHCTVTVTPNGTPPATATVVLHQSLSGVGANKVSVTTAAPSHQLTGVEITGASHIPVPKSTTTTVNAVAVYDDGTRQDVTDAATWTSSDEAVATVAGGEIRTTEEAGSTTITATFGSKSADVTVLVLGGVTNPSDNKVAP